MEVSSVVQINYQKKKNSKGEESKIFEFVKTVAFHNQRTVCIKNVFTNKKLVFMSSDPGI